MKIWTRIRLNSARYLSDQVVANENCSFRLDVLPWFTLPLTVRTLVNLDWSKFEQIEIYHSLH